MIGDVIMLTRIIRDTSREFVKSAFMSSFYSNTGSTPYTGGHTSNIAKAAVAGTSLAMLGLGKLMESKTSFSGELPPTDAADIHEM